MNNAIKTALKSAVSDGIFLKNPLFISGMIIGPVVAVLTTYKIALAFIVAFSVITVCSVLICSFYSRRIVYAVRIILYTITASLVYMVVIMFLKQFMPLETNSLGIFIPLLVTNSLIVSRTELRFFRKKKLNMLYDLFGFVIGFDAAVFVFAFVREVLTYGSIGMKVIGLSINFPVLAYPFGGFILLGLMSALYRKIVVSCVLADDEIKMIRGK